MTLTFELLTLKLVRLNAHGVLNLALVGDIGRLGDIDLWPWRSRRLSVIRVFVLRLTKFEVRRPFHSEDIAHLLCEH